MRDQRVERLAKLLVTHSVRVQSGENVLIDVFGDDRDLARALIEEVYRAGGYPFIQLNDPKLTRAMLLGTSEEQMNRVTQLALEQMKAMDCYIAIRGTNNINEYSDVPDEKQRLFMSIFNHRVHSEERVKNTKWCVMRYPNGSMAQSAQMSTEQFEDFFFDVCLIDYRKMEEAMQPLKERMERTDRVQIVGRGTDLSFSIKGIPAIPCAGSCNIPDGEVYTAPVRDSVNGIISYNTPTVYQGFTFENIVLQFRDGQIVEATAGNQTDRLNQILNTDEGARFIGEFAIGVNPYINTPMKDILFDEKINGSFHFTPGQAYEEADNGNRSAVHWDMVCIQRADYGGGEMYFDGELIRKDGRFIPEYLHALNPENLG
ncbi:aminopeptidase [Risungbinella massiliensis]|uniref:aminopeptidase n=1 Tax=Risungbinella massiliensis TaxID=1329796 RepID=UPI0005CC08B3|nr:aminopeptidase [Risungbinella massiliensis]